MKWYVRTECGDVRGPMSQEDAEFERDRLDGAVMYNERIFEPEFVTTEEVETILAEMKSVATAGIVEAKEIAEKLVLLSREKVVTGSIEGGVLNLGEVPEGVSIDIRDYDTDGVDPDLVKTDDNGDTYFEVG